MMERPADDETPATEHEDAIVDEEEGCPEDDEDELV